MWQSQEYSDLYFEISKSKFTINQEAQAALLTTGKCLFSHVLPNGEGLSIEQFQATMLCQSLYKIRESLVAELD